MTVSSSDTGREQGRGFLLGVVLILSEQPSSRSTSGSSEIGFCSETASSSTPAGSPEDSAGPSAKTLSFSATSWGVSSASMLVSSCSICSRLSAAASSCCSSSIASTSADSTSMGISTEAVSSSKGNSGAPRSKLMVSSAWGWTWASAAATGCSVLRDMSSSSVERTETCDLHAHNVHTKILASKHAWYTGDQVTF